MSGEVPAKSARVVVPYFVVLTLVLIGMVGVTFWLKPFSKDCWSGYGNVLCREPVANIEFVKVSGGRFAMGCGLWQVACGENEKPGHFVDLSGFWMGKYEVTNGQWRALMGVVPSSGLSGQCGDDCPVVNVSWIDVQEFIKRLNNSKDKLGTYRLPTEAEWEYACRSGGKPENFCGGNDADLVGWFAANSDGVTHRVGTKAPNGLGIHDMSGNVWEWVEDWHGDAYYAHSAVDNPHGPVGGAYRMNRGGGWDIASVFSRSTARGYASPSNGGGNLGFRVVLVR